MKNILILILLLSFTACSDNKVEHTADLEPFYAPAAGTIIAADSLPIVGDLNNFYYSAKITSTQFSNAGKYILDVAYGANTAQSEIVYPELDRQIIPALRPDKTKDYAYIVGFYYEGDSSFNEYALVTASNSSAITKQIELHYLKAYYIDSVAKK
jgi:hypothetical protein